MRCGERETRQEREEKRHNNKKLVKKRLREKKGWEKFIDIEKGGL